MKLITQINVNENFFHLVSSKKSKQERLRPQEAQQYDVECDKL